jgi:hypothetical protein
MPAAVDDVLAAANARWGRRLRVRYRFPTGAEGVYLVEDGGGRYALRYWVGPAAIGAVFVEIHRRLERLRARGVPVPRIAAAGHVGPAYVELAEWVDGTPPRAGDDRLIDGALALLRSMRHAAVSLWRRLLIPLAAVSRSGARAHAVSGRTPGALGRNGAQPLRAGYRPSRGRG